MSGCGPGTRATCSAVLSDAFFKAYPPLGATPGVLLGGGGGLPHAICIDRQVTVYFVGLRPSLGVGGEQQSA
jgi:hypothetical protein